MTELEKKQQADVHLAAPSGQGFAASRGEAAGDRTAAPTQPGPPQDAQPAVPVLADDFRGDTPHLIRCIEALLALDAQGAVLPSSRGIGGHARTFLSAAASRLAAQLNEPPSKALATGAAAEDERWFDLERVRRGE